MINEVVPARAGTPWNFKEVAGGRVIEGASGSRRRGATASLPNSLCKEKNIILPDFLHTKTLKCIIKLS
jgi:hypothetical protein